MAVFVLAAPEIIAAAVAAGKAIVLVGSAVIAAVAINEATKDEAEESTLTDTKPRPCPCPPCVPPVATIAYEIHRVPPSASHWPCPSDHVHWFQRHQNPKNCQCFWKRDALPVTCLPSGGFPHIPPGAIPIP